ncbi:MAG: type II secretion system protein [Leptolyngbya sp. PLA2]|nr:type II secretion system protein [Leptolyngbya sp.]MCE7971971.1 type II secretion system protein [Leptolyngbya sp. PL-A2]MCQ3940905.1 hypothetical protein [cyanobacterium CYA1]MCZ7634058.1 type II secretion system GspH family protein [Phycisphaerales bacterium]MDL1905218.1 type II secretion system protein [Synechococcales cyanobacterium CNB]GIK19229.1 MAG: hypothetical protein BroJett004_13930 [Planctomycetota bacterium]
MKFSRAFSLIEIVLIAGIVAVLIAIALPALSFVRERSRDAASLANLRSHAAIVQMYAGEWRDSFPAITDPAQPYSTLHIQNYVIEDVPYFHAFYYWQFVLADDYYGGVLLHPSVVRPGTGGLLSYHYSCSLIADPRYWDEHTRFGPSQWRATRLGEVVFPSHKAVFVESFPTVPYFPEKFSRRRLNLALADGAAMAASGDEIMPPVRSGDGLGDGTFHRLGVYGMHTVGGVSGRDLR